MKNLFFAFLFIPAFAFASIEVTMMSSEKIHSKKMQAFLKDAGIMKVRPMFSSAEKKMLKKNGFSVFANSRILVLKNLKTLKRLQNEQKRLGISASLDPRAMKGHVQALDLQALQWAFGNNGEAQNVDIDPLTFYKVPGRAGEDLGLRGVSQIKGQKVLVAVLDTGVQQDHPALKSILHRNESECLALEKFLACTKENKRADCEKIWMDPKNPEVDLDQNGFPLDCSGWSLLSGTNAAGITGSPDYSDSHGHGTHVAGIIGADRAAGGTKGVSQNVEVLAVQVIGGGPNEPIKPLSVELDPHEVKLPRPSRQTFLADMVGRGVIYAINSGAKVISFSMGWPENQDSAFMRSMITEAQKRGIIVVAAAGNDSTRALLRPCAYPGVVCVGASGPDGAIAHYSNYGSGVDIVAPGTNILSTYPQSKRPIHLRQTIGYEYLTGTSQATPYISGILAELLSRGYPAQEAVARLLASARPVQKPLDLIAGTPHSPEKSDGSLLRSALDQRKYVLTGNVDVKAALQMAPEPMLVPVNKGQIEIKWNRQSEKLITQFAVKNIWQSLHADAFRFQVEVKKDSQDSIRPQIDSLEISPEGGEWKTGETRTIKVVLRISDDVPEKSRIPSEIDLVVRTEAKGKVRQFVVETDIVTSVSAEQFANGSLPGMQSIPIVGMPQERTEFIPVEENLDGKFKQDYWLSSYSKDEWKFWLMSQDAQGAYKIRGPVKIPALSKNVDYARIHFLRTDIGQDGSAEYILSVYDDQSAEKEPTPSPNHYVVFNSDLRKIEEYSYDSKKSQIPYSDGIKWMKIGGTLRPVWLGPGYDPDKKRDLWDIWQDPEDRDEAQELRLYYLNEKNELKALQKHQNYKLIDILQPTLEQKARGVVPILLAKNRGTENRPSYIYDFALAEMLEGKVENFRAIDLFAGEQVYRNLLDTRVGQVLTLDYEDEVSKGTFWFSEGRSKEQRLSVLLSDVREITNKSLRALRDKVDAALWVRTVFAGSALSGAFVLTNSEVQYHDLRTGGSVQKSMERYSFFPNSVMTNLQYPLTVDEQSMQTKLPALFTTESSGLSRGVKITVPHYKDGKLVELVAPAKLRLRAESGCKPMENPVWGGKKTAAFLDYYCADRSGQKMVRVELAY
jgi:subtilisin family serine protease